MIYLLMIDTPEEKRKFVLLYEKYRYLMQKVAMDVLNDRYMAEDAVHNAFLTLITHMDHIGELESVQTKRYLITIVKNAAIDIYRKKNIQTRKEIYIDELKEENMPMTYMETDMENEVLDILKNLPVRYRDIFLLKYSSHMKNHEIAKLCGIQEGTVRQRLSRGKALIEEMLDRLRENENGKNKSDR